jgi:hypothetical protein
MSYAAPASIGLPNCIATTTGTTTTPTAASTTTAAVTASTPTDKEWPLCVCDVTAHLLVDIH